jgi:voltage-gated sodium channel
MLNKLFLNDRNILFVIIINAITIFVQGFDSISPALYYYLYTIDGIATSIFVVEMLVKIRHYGWKKYISSNWNMLDFVLILLAVPSLMMMFTSLDFIRLEFLMVLRITRVFKFFRFIRFVPGVELLINGVSRALKASVLVLSGFFIYNIILSLLSCYLFKQMAPEYFGDPLLSLYTIFKVFTIEGWYEIPESMTEHSSSVVTFFTKLYFVMILVSGGIFGMSLVNSIFVESMVSENNTSLESKVDELTRKVEVLLNELEKGQQATPTPSLEVHVEQILATEPVPPIASNLQ